MILRSYFDWQTDVPMNERKTVEAESETQLAAADGLECYWNAFELPYTFPASYLDPQNYTSLLPLYSIPPEVIPYETLSSYPCPKCQKLIEDHYCSDLMPGVFDGVAVSPCPVLEDHQDFSSPVLSAVCERYYKVTVEALRVCRELAAGYFARWAALRKLLYQFLDCEGSNSEKGKTKRQILSLGAGFDTTYFQLQVLDFSCELDKLIT
ncbi:hypothetical protein GOBAR_AA11807 [Gossypium barbadense]|uniref:[Phosphatase 2A protein]-leucine-carboxy methyltransferase 1 n=1 Tax=Gossypium barbadense TaxID=3634 RepID=A0A2P5XZR8_GOSBA|nr:hypothetical protein GOBAR_AA11807 [Gossypium barbadense]